MKAVFFETSITKKRDKDLFIYLIHDMTAEELELYKEIKGEHYSEENGLPKWFNIEYYGEIIKLKFNRDKTGLFVDTSEEAKLRSLNRRFATVGGENHLEKELAKMSAQQIMGVAPIQTKLFAEEVPEEIPSSETPAF